MRAPFAVREAGPADHADFARFYAELEIENPVPDAERWVASMMPHSFFLEDAGRKVAYAFVEVFNQLGYVRHVVVDRDARGRGVGAALMETIADRLTARECTRWELNVKHDNAPAIRMYESFGMSVQHRSWVLRIDWDRALRVPAASDVEARGVSPEEEARVEREMHLPDGKVRMLRAQPGQVFLQLVDARGGLHGFARFDPRHPGAFPFRVRTLAHAGALLRALHPHRTPEHDWLQFVLEDAADVAGALMEHGARCFFEMLHYGGALPPPRRARAGSAILPG